MINIHTYYVCIKKLEMASGLDGGIDHGVNLKINSWEINKIMLKLINLHKINN